jgi:DNA-binding CsgD family transcriptional regulator
MARCITCGTELHPERAQKYDYCTAPECQEKNLKRLPIVTVGMNKAADEILILDEKTKGDLAGGRYRDQRKAWAGPQPQAATETAAGVRRSRPQARQVRPRPQAKPAVRQPWTPSQQRLALLYNEQGLRPAEIAAKLGISSHLVTQIILAARNRGKA